MLLAAPSQMPVFSLTAVLQSVLTECSLYLHHKGFQLQSTEANSVFVIRKRESGSFGDLKKALGFRLEGSEKQQRRRVCSNHPVLWASPTPLHLTSKQR